jgi:hypothetical protein
MFHFHFRSAALCMLTLLFVVLVSPVSAEAQSRIGIRAGISVDPDQFYFGGHADVGEITNRFWFRPNLEIGAGDSRTLFTFNGELAYKPSTNWKEWVPYLGGGPGLVIQSHHGEQNQDTDVGPGFNFVAGVEKRKGLLAEMKFGLLDSPSFKLGIGWAW